jgi:hypothetical protein
MEKSRFYQDFRRCVGQARFGAKAQVLGITRGALLPCKLVHTKMRTWKNYTFSRISEEALGNCPASQNFETGGELLLLQGAGFGHDTFVLLLCKLVHSKMRHMEGCHFIWISLGSFPRFGGFETGVENCCQGARFWHDTWGTAALQAGSQQDAAHMEECHINQGFRRGVRQQAAFLFRKVVKLVENC